MFKSFPSTCSGPEFIEGKQFKTFKPLKIAGIDTDISLLSAGVLKNAICGGLLAGRKRRS